MLPRRCTDSPWQPIAGGVRRKKSACRADSTRRRAERDGIACGSIRLVARRPESANIRDIVTVEGLSVIQSASPAPMQAKTLDVDFVRTDGTRLPVRLIHRVPVSPDGTIGASRTLALDLSGGDGREAGRIAEMRFARFFNNTPMAI